MARHRSSAVPLAWLYAALIVYASLYPFSGWRPAGHSPFAFLIEPGPRWWTGFDVGANLVGYLPLGLLVFGALVRSGRAPRAALAVAVLGGTLLSLALELLQNWLPQRVPSNVDLLLNALGSALGAAFGLLVHWRGGIERWQTLRERWFQARSAGGIALLLLWPFGLLFPAPVPLAVGQVLGRLQDFAERLLDGTAAAQWLEELPPASAAAHGLSTGGELLLVAAGLLAPCLIAISIARPGWRRVVLVAGAVMLGFVATTLSTAMNFGPDHALAWRTPHTLAGFALGALLAAAFSFLRPRPAAGLGLVALTVLVLLVAQAPADPYFAQSLQRWEQGRFIRFHGAAQWIGWLWPYAAMVYLLVRIGQPASDEARGPAT